MWYRVLKSTVSDLCKNLDPFVTAWNHRLFTTEYPFVIVDALYIKVREDGRVRSRGVMIATGITNDSPAALEEEFNKLVAERNWLGKLINM